jgi:anaerobic ribonucleoside-triphosphate reductase
MTDVNKINEQIEQLETKLNDPHLCKDTAQIYTRVSGYYRAVENFNIGKQSEFVDRVSFIL